MSGWLHSDHPARGVHYDNDGAPTDHLEHDTSTDHDDATDVDTAEARGLDDDIPARPHNDKCSLTDYLDHFPN
jgi:hypothetical protein